ncbi:protein FAM47E isoform X1 [Manis javanica]|uniref:protein FAM47E isoform X1 n=1 Tax=Manis javanica TaxID=9974 RepID=UPI003C6D1800
MADNRRQFRPGAPSRAPGGLNCRPGHKENLPSKGFTKPTPRLALPTSLDGQMRVFMRKGLDDFGSGSLPWVCHGAPQPAPKKRQNKLPVEVALPAKLLAARQAWRAFLEDVEAQLAPHPLALYPHLEEDMPVELLLKVLEVLDPDRKLEDSWAYCQGIRKRTKEPTQLLKKCSTQVSLGLSKKSPVSHPGQWLYEEKKPVETHLLHEGGPYHENVHKVVRDFCNWATTFGSSHIDEEFILKQFDIDYQSKPSCDVFHPIRPSQVPLELKKRVELNKLQKLEFSQKLDSEKKLQKPQTLRPAALLFGVLSFPMTSPWLTIVSLPEVPLLPCLPAHSFLWTQVVCQFFMEFFSGPLVDIDLFSLLISHSRLCLCVASLPLLCMCTHPFVYTILQGTFLSISCYVPESAGNN